LGLDVVSLEKENEVFNNNIELFFNYNLVVGWALSM
jgi:hypothetical protein